VSRSAGLAAALGPSDRQGLRDPCFAADRTFVRDLSCLLFSRSDFQRASIPKGESLVETPAGERSPGWVLFRATFFGHSALFPKGFTALLEKGSGLEPGIWDDWSTSVPGRNPLERRAGRLRNGGSCTGSVSRVRGRRGDSSSFDARVTVNSAAAGLGHVGHWEKHTGKKGFHRGHQIRLDDVRGGVCHGGRLWLQSPPFGPPGNHPATAFRGGHLRPLRGE
jgi:hypothetical protein